MELLNNFKDLFLSVWNKGILGVDIFQILIGIGIYLLQEFLCSKLTKTIT